MPEASLRPGGPRLASIRVPGRRPFPSNVSRFESMGVLCHARHHPPVRRCPRHPPVRLVLLSLAACGNNPAGDGAAAAPRSIDAGITTTTSPRAHEREPDCHFAAACKPDSCSRSPTPRPDARGRLPPVKIYNASRLRPDLRRPKEGMPSEAGKQFFLQYTSGTWTVLKTGLGVDCGDNAPEIQAACAVFEAAALASVSASPTAR